MLLEIIVNGLMCAAAVIGALYLMRHVHEKTDRK